jgi:phosphoribosylanthranilate isomerase
MTWVKICGITNLEDARVAADAGADALGFVFYEKSPRQVKPDKVREIVQQLDRGIETVGVFVDGSPEAMFAVATEVGLRAVQWHQTTILEHLQSQPEEGPLRAYATGDLKLYFVFPASGFNWVPTGMPFRFPGIFLDSSTKQQPGGTGKTFDWEKSRELVAALSQDANVIVAGGLNSSNVAQAIKVLRPYGVDVSSGVETRPGEKDPEKVRAFINTVREADQSV